MSTLMDEDAELTLLAEASAWRVRLSEAEQESDPAFEAWLAAGAAHQAAWGQVQASWDFLGDHAAAPEVLAIRRGALGRARRAGRARWASPPLRNVAAGFAAVALVAAVFGGYWAANRPDSYQTALGERRVVTLRDGSRISLDADSLVKVRYRERSRDLILVRGQARFDVAHDVERPFSVIARDQKVIATGTAFNVDLMGRQVLVTLIEGHVVVVDEHAAERPGAKPKPVELVSGQRLAVAAATPPRVEKVSLERTTAWQSGQLVFADEPLGTVVDRVSRYAVHPVLVGDDAAAAMKLSGVFNTGEPEAFVDIVTRYLPLRAERREDGAVVLHAKS
jgi:transmembrane sensor